jgi:methylthioribulose-1-phosphate dehydratase
MTDNPREIISEMCQNFYRLGWVSGTGGGISIRRGEKIYMAPSGVEKEKIRPEDVFVLNERCEVLEGPANDKLKLSECSPLFQAAYELRGAGAVLHSHSMNVCLATMLTEPDEDGVAILPITQLEMIKGIAGHGYYDTFELPVINNTPRESELTDSLRAAIERFPDTPAVAVRNHGIYVWGPNEIKAKTQAECIDYLCEAKLKMRLYNLDNIQKRPATAIGFN